MRTRFFLTIGKEGAANPLRIAIEVRVLLIAALFLIGSPMIFVVGTSWGARQVVADLLRQNQSLRMENASYREATTELVAQVSSLQAAAEDLGARAAIDPEAARAMDRLPASITNRAMGGGMSVSDVTAPLSTVMSSAEPAFGLLREVLHLIEGRLDQARPNLERREALAAATPSIWPVAGWLSSAYGNRTDPFNGGADFHSGLDISADHGQAVRATADGTVTSARYTGNFGNLVVLDHGFGIGTRYGHLSRFLVFEGQRIRRGDVVGLVGSTGRSTSAHLHYEVTLNGRSANPMRLLGR
jgi:murein DD-endopeptidase MepM/ murein hydrolase activator NlpD